MAAHEDFLTLFEAATTRPVIFANENGKRPQRPYVTVQLQLASPLPVHTGPVDGNGQRRLSAHRPVTIQLQCYGDGSWGVLDQMQLTLYTDSLLNLAESLNIGLQREPRLQDVPALLEGTKYEPRAILDIEAMYTGSIEEEVGIIETVNGTGTTTPGTAPELEFTVTLP